MHHGIITCGSRPTAEACMRITDEVGCTCVSQMKLDAHTPIHVLGCRSKSRGSEVKTCLGTVTLLCCAYPTH